MPHHLPQIPAFRDSPKTDRIQEVALRVVVELPEWNMHVIGTATLIAPHLAITAKHVLDDIVGGFGAKNTPGGVEVSGYAVHLYQVLPGPVYRIWHVVAAWICPTDIAILHLGLSDHDPQLERKSLRLRVSPPPSGHPVWAVGYRESRIEVTEDANGTHHIELNDTLTTSIGKVGQIFTERLDSCLHPFPCFEVLARFDHGMSGGLVIDENGALCGLVCSGLTLADPNDIPLSYATTLWPMLRTEISADRGSAYPRGVKYLALDLVTDKILDAVGFGDVDPKYFPGRELPRR